MIRKPIAEGRFYSDNKDTVFQKIHEFDKKAELPALDLPPENITGAVLPHAGHVYSGFQTVPFFKILNKYKIVPETFIILNPNHTGQGPEIALDEHQAWQNSIGTVDLDIELRKELPYKIDAKAQKNEHSAEVIIPFIQYYFQKENVRILPICLKPVSPDHAMEIAKNIRRAVKKTGRNTMLIASSDFSHYLPPQEGYKMDQMVLDKIDERDIEGINNTVIENQITVCGYCPIMVLMAYSGMLDNNYKTTILARGHSGMVHHSFEVVDYISILFQGKSDS
ncbi:MAG: AmmeMemoRadiSam system protein B [Bacteroidales bacterium]|nr:AmmeMemoRadiSam system protein B [Bacteroidales bacterium]